jgi:hypothetical protein
MKVKVGNKIYDGKKEPVMVILTEGEKKQIAEMGKAKKYCVYPSTKYWTTDNYKNIKEWMKSTKGVK